MDDRRSPVLKWAKRGLSHPRDTLDAVHALLRARLTFRSCQHVGSRPRLYGQCKIAGGERITIGDRFLMIAETVRCELTTHASGRLDIGENVFINYGSSISAHTQVLIGSGCRIGQYAILLDCDFHGRDPDGQTLTEDHHGATRPIVLEENVWIAARAIVLKGVTIGKGSVIAAGSVVSHDVPPGVLAGGVPARVVRSLS
jgi:maltose O-acetyltransferase